MKTSSYRDINGNFLPSSEISYFEPALPRNCYTEQAKSVHKRPCECLALTGDSMSPAPGRTLLEAHVAQPDKSHFLQGEVLLGCACQE